MRLLQPLASFEAPVVPRADGEGARAFARGPLRPAALAPTRSRISTASVARMLGLTDTSVVVGGVIIAGASAEVGLMQMTLADAAPVLFGSWLILASLGLANGAKFGLRGDLGAHLAKIAAIVVGASAAAALIGAVLTGARSSLVPIWGVLVALGLLASHTLWWRQAGAWRAAGRMTPNIVVVGATDNARKLIEAALDTREVAVMGVFDDRLSRSPEAVSGVPVLGDTAALLAHPLLPYVDHIVITVAPWAQERVRDLIDRLRILPNAITLFMDTDGVEARNAALARLAGSGVERSQDTEKRAFDKRAQDLVLGALALVAAAPIMAVVALAVRLDSPGPIFFRQRRHGFNNEAITVWKFRSMRVEAADATASRQVSKDDDRVTRVGRVIRKLSLDELPQLFNVMTGEMSLVGPRPHAIGMKTAGEDSARLVADYAWRHRMKPGLTGWAQINGSIGAVDTPDLVRRRVAMDVEYIETQSFWKDVYILAVTVPALIHARNLVR